MSRGRQLYVDPNFDCEPYPLHIGQREKCVTWLRPLEIVERGRDPVFICQGESRFDLNQGKIGDCWLLAGLTCLIASRQKTLLDRCIPPKQTFSYPLYTGKFVFNFWHFGEWKEVVIDDRLPTVEGKLVYAHNESEPDEFWVPLLEKAYAKLHGGYDCIHCGGFPSDAIVDLTGGISEPISLDGDPDNIFQHMSDMNDACSTLTCGILHKPRMPNCFKGGHCFASGFSAPSALGGYIGKDGIVTEHAYSIIKLATVTTGLQGLRTQQLICLHNPWGRQEWNGPWSDGSEQWQNVSLAEKRRVGYSGETVDDGEFWMSFQDFFRIFDHVWICHLNPDEITGGIATTENWWQWERFEKTGCFADQILYDMEIKGHAVISLIQKSERFDRNTRIAFQIMRKRDLDVVATCGPDGSREVVKHLGQLPKCNYLIVPSASVDGDRDFLLRVFAQRISVPQN